EVVASGKRRLGLFAVAELVGAELTDQAADRVRRRGRPVLAECGGGHGQREGERQWAGQRHQLTPPRSEPPGPILSSELAIRDNSNAVYALTADWRVVPVATCTQTRQSPRGPPGWVTERGAPHITSRFPSPPNLTTIP